MYKVIGTPQTRAFRVIWMLEELELPYELVPAPPRSEGVVAFNPSGKVPVLIDNGTPITDSTAIIQYLADKHGQLTHPAGTLERARQVRAYLIERGIAADRLQVAGRGSEQPAQDNATLAGRQANRRVTFEILR